MTLLLFVEIISLVKHFVHSVEQKKQPLRNIPSNKNRKLDDYHATYKLKGSFLSCTELAFFKALRQATPLHIAPMVRIADLLHPESSTDQQRALNDIGMKHVDFVLCQPDTMQPVLAIELDDKSHLRSDRIKRDEIVNNAFDNSGLPLMHYPTLAAYGPKRIAQTIKEIAPNVPINTIE